MISLWRGPDCQLLRAGQILFDETNNVPSSHALSGGQAIKPVLLSKFDTTRTDLCADGIAVAAISPTARQTRVSSARDAPEEKLKGPWHSFLSAWKNHDCLTTMISKYLLLFY